MQPGLVVAQGRIAYDHVATAVAAHALQVGDDGVIGPFARIGRHSQWFVRRLRDKSPDVSLRTHVVQGVRQSIPPAIACFIGHWIEIPQRAKTSFGSYQVKRRQNRSLALRVDRVDRHSANDIAQRST